MLKKQQLILETKMKAQKYSLKNISQLSEASPQK
jgi:hypothetical protein